MTEAEAQTMSPMPATSPVIAKKPVVKKPGSGMSFFSALRKVTDGKKITRDEWDNPEIYGVLKDGILQLYGGETGDGRFHTWTISEGDLLAEDWRIL